MESCKKTGLKTVDSEEDVSGSGSSSCGSGKLSVAMALSRFASFCQKYLKIGLLLCSLCG